MTIEKLEALEPIFGSWYVDSKLAEGRSSKVYKIYKTVDGKPKFQALKAVRFPSGDKELSLVIESGKYKTVNEYLDKLEKTVSDNMNKMLSLRTNPNIVRYDNFKIIREKSCFYVIMLMELLSPFSERVKVESITKEQVVKISSDLCHAVEGFRNAGIIHHQIKPENIYVDGEGNFKLGDFGISNLSERIRTEASPYMAPEVYSKSAYDTSSDIYSIGVLMYKLLNKNRLPFLPAFPNPVSLNDRELAFDKQMRGEKLSPPSNADREMASIIFKALAYNQSDRYYSPALMCTELERYLEKLYAPKVQPVQPIPVYIPVAPPPVITAPQINNFASQDAEAVRFASYNRQTENEISVTDTEKAAYKAAFSEEEPDTEEEDKSDNKKIYIIVGSIIAIVAIIIGLLAFGPSGNDKKPGPTASSVSMPTVTATQAPTVATTAAPTVPTATTTETTAVATTNPTTETTTEAATTEITTSTTAPTTQTATETPMLITFNNNNGDKADDGRIYTELEDYTVIETPDNGSFGQVAIDIGTPLGNNVVSDGPAYIYEMSGNVIIQKVSAELICIDSEEGTGITCYISVADGDFYYSPDMYQYYVCLEEGAIESDSVISLPLQLEV